MRLLNSSLRLVLILLVTGHASITAQLMLAPSFVFIDEKSGVGNLYITNNGNEVQEVTLSFAFGYPTSDSLGNIIMNYADSAAFDKFALDPVIRAFPKSFYLNSGESRTVRIQIIPGKHPPEGFWFTRLKVMSRTVEIDKEVDQEEKIGTKILFSFEQITAVFYKRGLVSTGLIIKDVYLEQSAGKLEIRPHLERTGNAPFLGSMFVKLLDDKGRILSESQSTITTYFNVVRRIDLELDHVPPGTYTLELSFETRRNDMMAGDLVQAPRLVHKSVVVLK